MIDLMAQLQAALGDAYRIERELGRGGMSRLYLATEASLNRQVVVKLLPPELTSEVSAARFKREIETVSMLQHPHILPILAAGARDGLLYYIMPYIPGESLRHRLERERPLPVEDAVRILREIGDALELAHSHGVVHRDIKPENILLPGDHAVLTDFGVARALHNRRPSGRLTGAGAGVGTPGYMSPEQALGESEVDATSDVYGLAVVGYEMLAGKPPFSGPTLQAVLAAHVRDIPPPLVTIRPEVPKAVSDAVARALSKDPRKRYPTAGAFRDALGGSSVPSGSGAPARPRRRRALAFLLPAAAVLVAAGAWLAMREGAAPSLEAGLVAVAPFQVLDPALALWREGLVDVLSRNLDGAGSLRAVPPTIVIRRWSGRVDVVSATALGHATHARYVVAGSLLGAGQDSARLSAMVFDIGTRRTVAEFTVTGLISRMDRLTDSVTLAIIRALDPSAGPARMSTLGSTSLPAIKAFLEGEQYYRRVRWDSASAAYARAIGADSTFALALMRQADIASWVSGPDNPASRALGARAGRYDHGLGPRESLLVAANALMDVTPSSDQPFALARQVRALATEATRRYPEDPEAWHLLAESRMHFGTGGELDAPAATVLDAEQHAIGLDSAYLPPYIHAIEIALAQGDLPRARALLARFAAAGASGPQADGMRFVGLALDPATAWKPAMLAVLDTLNDFSRSAAVSLAADFMDADETAYRIARARLANLDRLPEAVQQTALLEAADLAFGRGHAHTADSLRQWWFASHLRLPEARTVHYAELCLLGLAPAEACHGAARAALRVSDLLQVLRWQYIWAAAGDQSTILEATIAHAESLARADTAPRLRAARRYVIAATGAQLLLARGDSAAALKGFDALPDSLCATCLLERLGHARLLAARGQVANARTLLDRRVPDAIQVVAPSMALLQLERARLAERQHDGAAAIAAYTYVSEAWAHADPALMPVVLEARAALKRLGADQR